MTTTQKISIVSAVTIATVAGMLMGSVLKPAQAEGKVGAEILCRPGDLSTSSASATPSVASESSDQSTVETATPTNTTNNSHVHNERGLVNVNDVVVKDVVDVNNNSILNGNTVNVLTDVLDLGDVTATVDSTVKTVVGIL